MCTLVSITYTVSELVTCGKLDRADIHLEWEWEAESRQLSKVSVKTSMGALSSGGSNCQSGGSCPCLTAVVSQRLRELVPKMLLSPLVKTCTTVGSNMMHRRHVQTPQTYRGKTQPASLHPLKAAAKHVCYCKDNIPRSKRHWSPVQREDGHADEGMVGSWHWKFPRTDFPDLWAHIKKYPLPLDSQGHCSYPL